MVVTNSGHGYIAGSGDMALTDCSAQSCGIAGVRAYGEGCKVHVEGCTFKQNSEWGVLAELHAEVIVKGCHSSQHVNAGYVAVANAQVNLSCVSEGDRKGCSTGGGGRLTLEDVTVNGTLQSGQMP